MREPDPEDTLARLEEIFENEDISLLKSEVKRAREIFPDSLEVLEWEAVLESHELEFEKALAILDRVLAVDPSRDFAAMERASLLVELWRIDEARAQLEQLLKSPPEDWTELEEAEAHFELACVLDRSGDFAAATGEFRRAAELAPEEFPIPSRMKTADFESIVAQAMESLPPEIAACLKQVSVVVQDYPPRDAPSPTLLGLYVGLPRTERSHGDRNHLDTVFVFQRNHELLNLEPAEMREEIRKTVVHEIAHHFGLGEADMGDYA